MRNSSNQPSWVKEKDIHHENKKLYTNHDIKLINAYIKKQNQRRKQCDLISINEGLTVNKIKKLSIHGRFAYVRNQEGVWFVDKNKKTIDAVITSQTPDYEQVIKIFDDQLKPSIKSKTLTESELNQIKSVTHHEPFIKRISKSKLSIILKRPKEELFTLIVTKNMSSLQYDPIAIYTPNLKWVKLPAKSIEPDKLYFQVDDNNQIILNMNGMNTPLILTDKVLKEYNIFLKNEDIDLLKKYDPQSKEINKAVHEVKKKIIKFLEKKKYLKRIVGAGGGGEIRLAQNLNDGNWCVAKYSKDINDVAVTKKENEIAKQFQRARHDLILDQHISEKNGASTERTIMVMDLLQGDELDRSVPGVEWLDIDADNKEVNVLSLLDAMDASKQMCEQVHCLHDKAGYIHRDIKPQNFMYDANHKRISLIDFGSAIRIGTKSGIESEVTTPYIAPELIMQLMRQAKINDDKLNEYKKEMLRLKKNIDLIENLKNDEPSKQSVHEQEILKLKNERSVIQKKMRELNKENLQDFTAASDTYALGLTIGKLLGIVKIVNGADLLKINGSDQPVAKDGGVSNFTESAVKSYLLSQMKSYFNTTVRSASLGGEKYITRGRFANMYQVLSLDELKRHYPDGLSISGTKLSQDQLVKVTDFLQRMTHIDPGKRPPLLEAAAFFNNMSKTMSMNVDEVIIEKQTPAQVIESEIKQNETSDDRYAKELIQNALLHKELMHVKDDHGCTPLHWAASNGTLKDVINLCQQGALSDLEVVDHYGRTPLVWAIIRGDIALVKQLFSYGALLPKGWQDISLAEDEIFSSDMIQFLENKVKNPIESLRAAWKEHDAALNAGIITTGKQKNIVQWKNILDKLVTDLGFMKGVHVMQVHQSDDKRKILSSEPEVTHALMQKAQKMLAMIVESGTSIIQDKLEFANLKSICDAITRQYIQNTREKKIQESPIIELKANALFDFSYQDMAKVLLKKDIELIKELDIINELTHPKGFEKLELEDNKKKFTTYIKLVEHTNHLGRFVVQSCLFKEQSLSEMLKRMSYWADVATYLAYESIPSDFNAAYEIYSKLETAPLSFLNERLNIDDKNTTWASISSCQFLLNDYKHKLSSLKQLFSTYKNYVHLRSMIQQNQYNIPVINLLTKDLFIGATQKDFDFSPILKQPLAIQAQADQLMNSLKHLPSITINQPMFTKEQEKEQDNKINKIIPRKVQETALNKIQQAQNNMYQYIRSLTLRVDQVGKRKYKRLKGLQRILESHDLSPWQKYGSVLALLNMDAISAHKKSSHKDALSTSFSLLQEVKNSFLEYTLLTEDKQQMQLIKQNPNVYYFESQLVCYVDSLARFDQSRSNGLNKRRYDILKPLLQNIQYEENIDKKIKLINSALENPVLNEHHKDIKGTIHQVKNKNTTAALLLTAYRNSLDNRLVKTNAIKGSDMAPTLLQTMLSYLNKIKEYLADFVPKKSVSSELNQNIRQEQKKSNMHINASSNSANEIKKFLEQMNTDMHFVDKELDKNGVDIKQMQQLKERLSQDFERMHILDKTNIIKDYDVLKPHFISIFKKTEQIKNKIEQIQNSQSMMRNK